jgi:hypothetical protein
VFRSKVDPRCARTTCACRPRGHHYTWARARRSTSSWFRSSTTAAW